VRNLPVAVTKTLDGTCGLLRIGYSLLLRQSLLAGNKPLKEAKGRFKISIDAVYNKVRLLITGARRKTFDAVSCLFFM
jgi:hypothetical protein